MKFISWNVNGFRACLGKNFMEVFNDMDADFFCIQETKMQQGQVEINLNGYEQFWNSADKRGYSGTAIFTKHKPISVAYDMPIGKHSHEGRIITLDMGSFYLVNSYSPNSKEKLERIEYRMEWEDDFRNYVVSLNQQKPVIICGDLNVAHNEIDLKNPKSNRKNAGFTDEERGKMTELLSSGFCDTFRNIYPDKTNIYTWWSYRFNARKNNSGWRIDYFIVSDEIKDNVTDSIIHDEILGSDHCPVELRINI